MRKLLLFAVPALILALVLLGTFGSVPALTRLLTGAAFGATGAAGGSGDDQGRPPELPVVGSYANLKALLEKVQREKPRYGVGVMMKADMAANTVHEAAPMRAPAAAPAASPGANYSRTNVQVAGVDEADIVKTDGQYIYQVNGRRVVVARAYPAAAMQVTSILAFPEEKFTPRELYVDDKYLVVIGSTHRDIPWQPAGPPLKPQTGPSGGAPQPPGGPQDPAAAGSPAQIAPLLRPGGPVPEIFPPPTRRETVVKAIIYDLGDREHLKQVREVELEGNYVSSRKIGTALYLVANRYLDYYYIMNEKGDARPSYRDSARGSSWVLVDYRDIRYFPDFADANYLLVAGLNLDRPQEEMHIATYLGAGENIYASPENLYVAVTHYRAPEVKPLPQPAPGLQPDTSASSVAVPPRRPFIWPRPAGDARTTLYKFALDQGRTKYLAQGEVPGTVLNQFSMDEYQGYFRVATTRGEVWRSDAYTAKNNVYILDAGLQVAGRLEDIAPGERIYSVRFMGGRGYMVTFKKVDPLFVIDLQDPQQPKILGALKIPGYSDYLHPYDENYIIGFGKDTIEMPVKDFQGNERDTMTFYQGMKMALFDVSDVQHPVEKFKESIGDRGTDSELLRNHKALLFDREKGLLAFPVTVMEVKNKAAASPGGPPAYGEFTFQGAYVYHINLEQGFTLRGRVTHLDDQDFLRAGQHRYEDQKNVNRILYIDNSLYTLSRAMIKAHDLTTLQEQNTLAIPVE
ncbi:beta-propeller domain-containing protein [Neomoorella mulderi]|uniref:Beta propeller domain protein n=1 Tax=Moorella mulderi DSM 14980 TaxID=1122241 RepID=A0A151B084_9FIRM|nr:beta-propeller domain-containing protein [Moorella mulderi]KYH33329.1 beta propeller domain protein [Moorella mulderi DSM 14980]